MKFLCDCGYMFRDQTDDLPFKGYIYPDQSQEKLYEAINKIFASERPSDDVKFDEMINDIVSPKGIRTIYQCPECGTIYINEDKGKLSAFSPKSNNASKNLLKGGK